MVSDSFTTTIVSSCAESELTHTIMSAEKNILLRHAIEINPDVFITFIVYEWIFDFYLFSDYGSVEGALRLNLKSTYFPIVEIGYGTCKTTDAETNISYSTSAPFFRIGLDFNILKDKYQDNRLFVGARYGFSSLKFDMSGPNMTDPIWGGTAPFNYKNASSNSSWMELVFGVQTKIWRNFHMGWSVRYKQQLKIGQPDYAKPYYIPGYGTTTNTSCWGGTYNLIFDLNWGKKKRKAPITPPQNE